MSLPASPSQPSKDPLRATDEDVVEGDVDELDDITDGTHDCCDVSRLAAGQRGARMWNVLRKPRPTACEILRNSRRSAASQLCQRHGHASTDCCSRWSLTLLRLADELDALLEELARHVEDLLHLVGHFEGRCVVIAPSSNVCDKCDRIGETVDGVGVVRKEGDG